MTDRDLKQPASALTTARLLPTSPVVAAPKPIAGTTQTLSTTSPIAIRSNRSAVAAAGGGLLDPYAFPSDSFRMDVKSIASARPVPSGVHSLSFGALKANQPKSAPAANLKLLSPKASKKSTTNGHNSESRFTTDPDGDSKRRASASASRRSDDSGDSDGSDDDSDDENAAEDKARVSAIRKKYTRVVLEDDSADMSDERDCYSQPRPVPSPSPSPRASNADSGADTDGTDSPIAASRSSFGAGARSSSGSGGLKCYSARGVKPSCSRCAGTDKTINKLKVDIGVLNEKLINSQENASEYERMYSTASNRNTELHRDFEAKLLKAQTLKRQTECQFSELKLELQLLRTQLADMRDANTLLRRQLQLQNGGASAGAAASDGGVSLGSPVQTRTSRPSAQISPPLRANGSENTSTSGKENQKQPAFSASFEAAALSSRFTVASDSSLSPVTPTADIRSRRSVTLPASPLTTRSPAQSHVPAPIKAPLTSFAYRAAAPNAKELIATATAVTSDTKLAAPTASAASASTAITEPKPVSSIYHAAPIASGVMSPPKRSASAPKPKTDLASALHTLERAISTASASDEKSPKRLRTGDTISAVDEADSKSRSDTPSPPKLPHSPPLLLQLSLIPDFSPTRKRKHEPDADANSISAAPNTTTVYLQQAA